MSTVQGGPGNIVTNGLVLYLDAANPLSYPGTGTTWRDLSGNSNNGTLINGPTFNSGNLGSIVFDGVDDYVLNTDTNFPSGGNSRTFSVWFKTPSSYPPGSDIPMFLIYGASDFNQGMFFGWEGRNIGGITSPYRLMVSNYGNQAYSNTILSLNTIYNAVVTKPLGSEFYTFYLNGIVDGTNTWTGGNYTTTNTVLNGSSKIGGNVSTLYLKGNLYSMQIYNRVLSSQEILQNYTAMKTRFGL